MRAFFAATFEVNLLPQRSAVPGTSLGLGLQTVVQVLYLYS